jgi:hypothetical protein
MIAIAENSLTMVLLLSGIYPRIRAPRGGYRFFYHEGHEEHEEFEE